MAAWRSRARAHARACFEMATGTCPRHALQLAPPSPGQQRAHWQWVLNEIILPRRANATWNNYYDDLVEVLLWKRSGTRAFKKHAIAHRPLRTLEVGTMYGGASERIMRKLGEGVQHFVVDPFLAGFDDKDIKSVEYGLEARRRNMSSEQLSRAWAEAMAYDFHRHFGCRYSLLYAKSLEAAQHFEDGSLDAAFIDGLHTFSGVLADITAWWPKLSPQGGVMLFNDYESRKFPGVKKAIRTFFRPRGLMHYISVGNHGRPPGWRNAYMIRAPRAADGRW